MAPTTRKKRKVEDAFSKMFTPLIDENPDYWNRNKNVSFTYKHIKFCKDYWDKSVNPKLERDIDEATHKRFKKTEFSQFSKISVKI